MLVEWYFSRVFCWSSWMLFDRHNFMFQFSISPIPSFSWIILCMKQLSQIRFCFENKLTLLLLNSLFCLNWFYLLYILPSVSYIWTDDIASNYRSHLILLISTDTWKAYTRRRTKKFYWTFWQTPRTMYRKHPKNFPKWATRNVIQPSQRLQTVI